MSCGGIYYYSNTVNLQKTIRVPVYCFIPTGLLISIWNIIRRSTICDGYPAVKVMYAPSKFVGVSPLFSGVASNFRCECIRRVHIQKINGILSCYNIYNEYIEQRSTGRRQVQHTNCTGWVRVQIIKYDMWTKIKLDLVLGCNYRAVVCMFKYNTSTQLQLPTKHIRGACILIYLLGVLTFKFH